MSAPQTIAWQGQSWPLDTVIDTLSFTRFTGEVPELAEKDHPLEFLTDAGEIVERPARTMPWHTVLAYRAPDLSQHVAQCDFCSNPAIVRQRPVAQRKKGEPKYEDYAECGHCWDSDLDGCC